MGGNAVRSRLQVTLGSAGIGPPLDGVRHIDEDDVAALGVLMWEAYRGTPDEEDAGSVDEAQREVRLTLDGEYGMFLPSASFVVEDEGRPVAAALVTLYRGLPLLAFLFTVPSHSGRGLGRALIQAVMHALAVEGHEVLTLAVTRRNRRARRLYDRLGFVEVV